MQLLNKVEFTIGLLGNPEFDVNDNPNFNNPTTIGSTLGSLCVGGRVWNAFQTNPVDQSNNAGMQGMGFIAWVTDANMAAFKTAYTNYMATMQPGTETYFWSTPGVAFGV